MLLRRDAMMAAYEPPPEGTVLLDDLRPVVRPAAGAPVEGTMLLDDMPDAAALAPPPVDFGEGTGLMTLEEIAEMHWGGETPTEAAPAEDSRARRWTRGEIEVLQKAVNDALEPEATLLMSRDELAALRGEKVERPEPTPAPPAAVAASGEIAGLEPLPPELTSSPAGLEPAPPDGLEPIPGLEPLPPAQAQAQAKKTFDADEVTMLTLDDVARMREAMLAAKQQPKQDDDDTGGDA